MDETARAALDAAVRSLPRAPPPPRHSSSDAAIEVRDCLAIDLADRRPATVSRSRTTTPPAPKHSRDVAQTGQQSPTRAAPSPDAGPSCAAPRPPTPARRPPRAARQRSPPATPTCSACWIISAVQERTDLQRRRDAVPRQRGDADRIPHAHRRPRRCDGKLAALKVAAEAWKQVVNEVAGARSAVPRRLQRRAAERVVHGLRPGHGGLPRRARRPAGRVHGPVGRQQVMATAAMAVAMANTAGNKWRAVILDDCDRIIWATSGRTGLPGWPVRRVRLPPRRGRPRWPRRPGAHGHQPAHPGRGEPTPSGNRRRADRGVRRVHRHAAAPTPPPAPAATNDEPDAASGEAADRRAAGQARARARCLNGRHVLPAGDHLRAAKPHPPRRR